MCCILVKPNTKHYYSKMRGMHFRIDDTSIFTFRKKNISKINKMGRKSPFIRNLYEKWRLLSFEKWVIPWSLFCYTNNSLFIDLATVGNYELRSYGSEQNRPIWVGFSGGLFHGITPIVNVSSVTIKVNHYNF